MGVGNNSISHYPDSVYDLCDKRVEDMKSKVILQHEYLHGLCYVNNELLDDTEYVNLENMLLDSTQDYFYKKLEFELHMAIWSTNNNGEIGEIEVMI